MNVPSLAVLTFSDEEFIAISLQVPAEQLKVGDEVVVDGVPTQLTSVDFILGEVRVLKITFQPDLPVAVFHPRPCIHSLGHKPKKPHRGGKNRRMVRDGADAVSIPDTQGYLTDCNLAFANI